MQVRPRAAAGALREHAAKWADAERFFVSRDGSPMRGNAVCQAFVRARKKVELPGLSFHDLRHTGQTLAAATGTTLAELKRRLGHSSAAASLRYLHAVEGRDRGGRAGVEPARGSRGHREAPP